jgi:hypothetical protein
MRMNVYSQVYKRRAPTYERGVVSSQIMDHVDHIMEFVIVDPPAKVMFAELGEAVGSNGRNIRWQLVSIEPFGSS